MLSISAAVEAVSNAIKSVFDFASTAKENQSETEIINDKNDCEQANNDALKALKVADKYKEYFTMKDRILFKYFYSEFLKEK